MNKLLSLEIKRNRLRPYHIAVLIGGFILLAFHYFMAAIPLIDPAETDIAMFSSYDFLFHLNHLLSMATFGILGAVMGTRFVIEEYSGGKGHFIILLSDQPKKDVGRKAMAGFLLSCCRHAAVWDCDRQCVLRYPRVCSPYVLTISPGKRCYGRFFPFCAILFWPVQWRYFNMDWVSEKIYSRNDCSGGHCRNNPMSSVIGSFFFPSSVFYSVGRCSNPHNGSCEKYVLSSRKYGGVSDDGKRI